MKMNYFVGVGASGKPGLWATLANHGKIAALRATASKRSLKVVPRKRNEEARAHRILVTCYLVHSFYKKTRISIIIHIVYYLIRPESPITSRRCRLVRLSVSGQLTHVKGVTDPVYMSQLATTEKFVQQTSAKNPITGPVYMSKAPRSTEYFDRGVSENFV